MEKYLRKKKKKQKWEQLLFNYALGWNLFTSSNVSNTKSLNMILISIYKFINKVTASERVFNKRD